jgi:hypothetical protein
MVHKLILFDLSSPNHWVTIEYEPAIYGWTARRGRPWHGLCANTCSRCLNRSLAGARARQDKYLDRANHSVLAFGVGRGGSLAPLNLSGAVKRDTFSCGRASK